MSTAATSSPKDMFQRFLHSQVAGSVGTKFIDVTVPNSGPRHHDVLAGDEALMTVY